MPASNDPPPSCSKCLNSKPHEIPDWIIEGRLGEHTTRLYKKLSSYHGATDTECDVATLLYIYEKLSGMLRSLRDEEEELVVLQADLVNEMHRICVGIVNVLLVAQKSEPEDILWGATPESDKLTRWAGIAHAHHLMWKSLHNFDNPPDLSTGARYGPHFDAADYYFEMAQSLTHEPGCSEEILNIADGKAELIWDAFQNPERSCDILYEGIKSAKKNLDPHPPEMRRIIHTFVLRLELITPEALERQNSTVMAAPDNDSTPSCCSKCLNSKPHETPTWIKPWVLGEAILWHYECLNHPDDFKVHETCWSILETLANILPSLKGRYSHKDFTQDNIVEEMHRICAVAVNDLSTEAENEETNPEDKIDCWTWIARFHYLMWKSFHNFENPPEVYTKVHGSHLGAAKEFFEKAHSSALKSKSSAILKIAHAQARFIWEAFGNPVMSCNILDNGIKLAEMDPNWASAEKQERIEKLRRISNLRRKYIKIEDEDEAESDDQTELEDQTVRGPGRVRGPQ